MTNRNGSEYRFGMESEDVDASSRMQSIAQMGLGASAAQDTLKSIAALMGPSTGGLAAMKAAFDATGGLGVALSAQNATLKSIGLVGLGASAAENTLKSIAQMGLGASAAENTLKSIGLVGLGASAAENPLKSIGLVGLGASSAENPLKSIGLVGLGASAAENTLKSIGLVGLGASAAQDTLKSIALMGLSTGGLAAMKAAFDATGRLGVAMSAQNIKMQALVDLGHIFDAHGTGTFASNNAEREVVSPHRRSDVNVGQAGKVLAVVLLVEIAIIWHSVSPDSYRTVSDILNFAAIAI